MRFKKIDIKFLSLVKRGANQIPVMYKGEGGVTMELLLKTDHLMDRGELTAVVYAPELRDSDGDITDAETIKDAMYSAMRKGFNLDIQHDFKALSKEDACPVESFIIQKGDPRFADMKDYAGKPIDVTGGWGVVISINKQELREKFRTGEWNGVSMAGSAVGIPEPVNKGDVTMTAAELAAALAANNTVLAAAIAKSVADAIKPKEPDAPAPVVKTEKPAFVPKPFTGAPTANNIKKHALEVQKAEVLHNMDMRNAESVAEGTAKIEKIDKDIAAVEAEITKAAGGKQTTTDANKTPELVAAEAALAKAQQELADIQKASNQPAGEGGEQKPEANVHTGLTKAQVEIAKAAGDAAARLNARQGGGNPNKFTKSAA